MNNTSLILALASGIFALSIAFISGGKVLSMLHTTSITTLKKELTIPLPADQRPLIFSFAEIPVVKYLSFEPFMWGESLFEEMMINYLPYEGKEIKAEFHYQIKTSDPVLKAKIEESLADPIYELSGEKLLLSLEGQQLFDAIVPFIPMNVSLDLYIPKDWKFNITNSLHANNLHKPEWTKKWGYYDPYYDEDTGRCSDWISYDKKANAFFCPLERNPSSSEKREIIEREIRKKADELSLLEGLNRERSFSHDARRYRELDSVLWKNDHRVIAKLSDKFFNLFVELEVEMNEKGELKILKSTLKELEQKGMMNSERIKLYQGWEELKQKGFTRKEEES